MRKSNICILVLSILALFFFSGIEAQATTIDYTPSYYTDSLYTANPIASNEVYHFYLGTDEVLCDENGTVYSIVGDNVYLDFEYATIASSLPTGDNYSLYDYFNFVITPHADTEWTSTEFDDLGTLLRQPCIGRHFVLIGGTKYYLSDGLENTISIANITADTTVSFGMEFQQNINYTGFSSSDSAFTSFYGWLTLSVTNINYDIELVGVRYTSTGEEAIQDSIISWGGIQYNAINSMKEAIKTAITTLQGTLTTKMQSLHDNMMLTLSDISTWLNDIWSEIVFGFDGVISKLDEVIETLSRGYDTTDADKSKAELDSSLDGIEAEQSLLISDSQYEVINYDVVTPFNFLPGLVSALSLVTSFVNVFFDFSGDFTTALTVMMSLAFVSVVLGLLRFVRG